MDTATISNLIRRRAATDDEWTDAVEKCWTELTDALTEDIDATRKFLLEDCTADEASWVSEVYDDIIYKTQSREYVDLHHRVPRVAGGKRRPVTARL